MTRISTPYNQQVYHSRLANDSNSLETHKAELKEKLSSLIKEKVQTLKLNSEDDLTDAHYRDILDSLHNAETSNGGTFHRILNNAGIKTVSKYSWFSNERATGKIEALKIYLDIDQGENKQSTLFLAKKSSTQDNVKIFQTELRNLQNNINKIVKERNGQLWTRGSGTWIDILEIMIKSKDPFSEETFKSIKDRESSACGHGTHLKIDTPLVKRYYNNFFSKENIIDLFNPEFYTKFQKDLSQLQNLTR